MWWSFYCFLQVNSWSWRRNPRPFNNQLVDQSLINKFEDVCDCGTWIRLFFTCQYFSRQHHIWSCLSWYTCTIRNSEIFTFIGAAHRIGHENFIVWNLIFAGLGFNISITFSLHYSKILILVISYFTIVCLIIYSISYTIQFGKTV